MQKASLEILKLIAVLGVGSILYWFWLKLRELAGFRAKARFDRVEEEIAKGVLSNRNTDLEDLVERENERARKRNS